MSRRVHATEARKEFAELVQRSAQGERIKITRYRNTVAAIISKKDLEKLEDCDDAQGAADKSKPTTSREPLRTRARRTTR